MERIPGRPAIYARFSSARQDERSIDDQVRRCRAHLNDQRSEVEVFADYAVSGAGLNRPGFEALMAAVKAGLVTTIVTEDISRISRDFADAAHIFKELQYARVPLIGIADGIDTSAKHAKLTFTLKSLVADLYLDDLRDKTLRGLEGRMLAGYATGQVPYGFRTRPEIDGHGRELGKQIEIDEIAARVVIRIYTEFASGRGMSAIARTLNREGIPSPRIGMRHRWSGWSVGTIREMLRNERYVGEWRFKEMQWIKVPGSNRRLPRKRPPSETMVQQRPDLQIVPLPLWEVVKAEIAGADNARFRPRSKSRYLLSGSLACSECGMSLTIMGSGPSYYRCPSRPKGLCRNSASLRAEQLLKDVFVEIRTALRKSPALNEALEIQNRVRGEVLNEQIEGRQKALAETEAQIERLVRFVADGGDRLDYVAERIGGFESDARVQKAELELLRNRMEKPLRKVSASDVDAAIATLALSKPEEVGRARLRLRRWTAGVPMRFDSRTLTIEISASALVADIANDGAALPSYSSGESIVVRMPVGYLVPKTKPRAPHPTERPRSEWASERQGRLDLFA